MSKGKFCFLCNSRMESRQKSEKFDFITRPIVAKIISVSSPARCQHWLSTSSPKVFKNQQTASTLLTHQTLKCCTLQNQASFFIQFCQTSLHLAFQSVFAKLQQQLATIQLQSSNDLTLAQSSTLSLSQIN